MIQLAIMLGLGWWQALVFLLIGLLQLLRWKRGHTSFREALVFPALSAMVALAMASPTLVFFIIFLLKDYPR